MARTQKVSHILLDANSIFKRYTFNYLEKFKYGTPEYQNCGKDDQLGYKLMPNGKLLLKALVKISKNIPATISVGPNPIYIYSAGSCITISDFLKGLVQQELIVDESLDVLIGKHKSGRVAVFTDIENINQENIIFYKTDYNDLPDSWNKFISDIGESKEFDIPKNPDFHTIFFDMDGTLTQRVNNVKSPIKYAMEVLHKAIALSYLVGIDFFILTKNGDTEGMKLFDINVTGFTTDNKSNTTKVVCRKLGIKGAIFFDNTVKEIIDMKNWGIKNSFHVVPGYIGEAWNNFVSTVLKMDEFRVNLIPDVKKAPTPISQITETVQSYHNDKLEIPLFKDKDFSKKHCSWKVFYNLFQQNKDKLLPKEYDNHPLNWENVLKWINKQCTEEARDFAFTFSKCIRYVSFSEFYDKFMKMSVDLREKIIQRKYDNVVLFMPSDRFTGSTFWLTLLAFGVIGDLVTYVDLRLENGEVIKDIMRDEKQHNNLAVCFDDAIYSGTELTTFLSPLPRYMKYCKGYIAVPFISDKFIESRETTTKMERKVLFENFKLYKDAVVIKSLESHFAAMKIQIPDTYDYVKAPDSLYSMIFGYRPISFPFYLDYKICDGFEAFDKIMKFGSYYKCSTTEEFEPFSLIKNCDAAVEDLKTLQKKYPGVDLRLELYIDMAKQLNLSVCPKPFYKSLQYEYMGKSIFAKDSKFVDDMLQCFGMENASDSDDD
jgi:hypothetical protein